MRQFFIDGWNFKLSLAPVIITYLLFEIPALLRRAMRVLYTPIYFIFFPLGHSDQLYAQYLNEDDFYCVGASQTEEQKQDLRKRIVAISIFSMFMSTIFAPLACGFLAAFYLTPNQFYEFIWLLMIVKFITVGISLHKLRHVSFIYMTKTFYLLILLYTIYLGLIWRAVTLSYEWTSEQLHLLGFGGLLMSLLNRFYIEIFIYVVIVSSVTWAATYLWTNPSLIRRPTFYEPEQLD